jgi:hypothetical protein
VTSNTTRRKARAQAFVPGRLAIQSSRERRDERDPFQ